jgi:hypothetical protein
LNDLVWSLIASGSITYGELLNTYTIPSLVNLVIALKRKNAIEEIYRQEYKKESELNASSRKTGLSGF